MNINIIDLSLKQDSFPRFKRDFGVEYNCIYYNGFKDKYPKVKKGEIVVLTGSEYSIIRDYEWLPVLLSWVNDIYYSNVPILGICYGHQLIARALADIKAVSKAPIPEMTFIPIYIIKNHVIFNELENPFHAMSAHYDMVKELPEGFEIIAYSKDCNNQIMIDKNRPAIGLQFHPEIDIETGKKCIYIEEKILIEKGLNPNHLLELIPHKPTGADRILRNIALYFREF
ncbi:MAG: gamma-glutamyl-gamma-aminobutyrate hydrolase family protein [Candidatus Coatesbacteria bacterium]|nr:gamma-glutamyl-gamma-aminobutyrate hydrolase family protein [Candidatus Coatesbacteria bacterium]